MQCIYDAIRNIIIYQLKQYVNKDNRIDHSVSYVALKMQEVLKMKRLKNLKVYSTNRSY